MKTKCKTHNVNKNADSYLDLKINNLLYWFCFSNDGRCSYDVRNFCEQPCEGVTDRHRPDRVIPEFIDTLFCAH